MPTPVSLHETAVSRTPMSCNRPRGFDCYGILLHNSDQTFRPCVRCRTTTPAGLGANVTPSQPLFTPMLHMYFRNPLTLDESSLQGVGGGGGGKRKKERECV